MLRNADLVIKHRSSKYYDILKRPYLNLHPPADLHTCIQHTAQQYREIFDWDFLVCLMLATICQKCLSWMQLLSRQESLGFYNIPRYQRARPVGHMQMIHFCYLVSSQHPEVLRPVPCGTQQELRCLNVKCCDMFLVWSADSCYSVNTYTLIS